MSHRIKKDDIFDLFTESSISVHCGRDVVAVIQEGDTEFFSFDFFYSFLPKNRPFKDI